MSIDHEFRWPAHPNIHKTNTKRDLNIYFSEPVDGVNEETGILLLIPGYGGNAKSNVYKKMRSQFSDKHNLVVLQCDYFGHEFMQDSKDAQLIMSKEDLLKVFTSQEIKEIFKNGFNNQSFLEIGSKKKNKMKFKETLQEDIGNFNDMGIMQALDNITALFYVIGILQDNNYKFNSGKIIVYGHSHGAYLGYLCNAFVSNLFTLMIDNSAWLFPQYLENSRHLCFQHGSMDVDIEFEYLASKLQLDRDILSLPMVYRNINNKCIIHCFHGITDKLIYYKEKENFCKSVHNSTMNLISKNEIDDSIFKSTDHGLDADFLMLFDYVVARTTFTIKHDLHFITNTLTTSKYIYQLSTDSRIPNLCLSPIQPSSGRL